MKTPGNSLESLMTSLGGIGKFQLSVHLLVAYTYIILGFQHVIMAFHGSPVYHFCDLQGFVSRNSNDHSQTESKGVNTTQAKCSATLYLPNGRNETVQCVKGQWTYKPVYLEKNIVSQFDLVCSDGHLANLATTLYFAGVMIGGLVFGDLADRCGRLPVMLLTLYLSSILGVAVAFSVNYMMFVILRFIAGILTQGLQTSAYTLIMELYVAKHRPMAGAITECFFGSSIMILAGLAFLLRDWRHLQIVISLTGLLAVFYPWYIPESLRWLIIKGRMDKAEILIKRITKINKIPFPVEKWHQLRKDVMDRIQDCKSVKQYNITDMFRNRSMRNRSFILFYIWLSISTTYYGLTFKMSTFQGNRYLTFFLGGLVETVIYAASLPIMMFFGRKKPLLACFIMAAASCLIAGFLKEYTSGLKELTTAFALAGRCAVSGLFGIIFVYTSEIYPTVIRNIGMGACCFWARAGGVLAPQINEWTNSLWKVDAIFIFGGMSILAGLLLFPLPETHDRELSDTLAEKESTRPPYALDLSEEDNPCGQEKTPEAVHLTTMLEQR